ncbi:hypothetical protein JCM5296_004968 [Sporobolomyces johnsonii]
MPPDRTQDDSRKPLSLPLSSHSAKHAPTLARGKACSTCDGALPICAPCAKSATNLQQDLSTVRCDYYSEEQRRKPIGGGKVAALEAQIAALEKRVAELTQARSASPAAGPSNTSSIGVDHPPTPPQLPPSSIFGQTMRAVTCLAKFNPDLLSLNVPPSTPDDGTSSAPSLPTNDEQLLWTSWPSDLPSPPLLSRLVDVYFSKAHQFSGMVNRTRFQEALLLGPTHPRFPAKCLLHAIVATASNLVSADIWEGQPRYWTEGLTPAQWHTEQASSSIIASFRFELDQLQVVQAAILSAFLHQRMGRYIVAWLEAAQAMRICVGLGLNHLRAPQPNTPLISILADRTFLGTARSEEELQERVMTFWHAMVGAIVGSAASGWSNCIDEKDITTLLPSPPGVPYPEFNLNMSPLSIHCPTFFTEHPPDLRQPMQLYIKAFVLLGRVATFLQRSPSPAGVGFGNGPQTESTHADLPNSPDFIALENSIIAFRHSLASFFAHDVSQNLLLDPRLSITPAILCTCMILLHENFCSMDEGDQSMAKCSASAKEIVDMLHGIVSTSFDVALLVPAVNFCWAVAGRTLVREIAIKQTKEIPQGVDQLKADVQAILAAMRSYRVPIGALSANALELLLSHPEICLPSHHVGQQGFGYPPVGSRRLAALTNPTAAIGKRSRAI